MGYMGLQSWGDSDAAAGAYSQLLAAMIKCLNREMLETANSINTDGCVNVALIIESGIFDAVPPYMLEDFKVDTLVQLLKKKVEGAYEAHAKEWGDEDNRKYHRRSYGRLLDTVERLQAKIVKDLK